MGLSSVIVQWLVDAGAENNGVDIDKRSALHHAVLAGNNELINILLNANVAISTKDNFRCTALHLAIERHNITAIVDFIDRLYREDTEGNSNLHFASAIDNVKSLEKCLTLNKTDYSYRGITVNDLNARGESALHIATEKRLLSIMSFLLDHGADVNIKNSITGDTPLHRAATKHWMIGSDFLLERGANRKIANAQGLLPRDIAVKMPQLEPTAMSRISRGLRLGNWNREFRLIFGLHATGRARAHASDKGDLSTKLRLLNDKSD